MEKMLITGASGFLGARIAAFYARKYDVLPCSHEKLDITNPTQVLSLFQQMRPQYVVHCAAVSDTGYAEKLIGGIFIDEVVVSDKNIITSQGPATPYPFAYRIAEILGKDTTVLRERMLYNFAGGK